MAYSDLYLRDRFKIPTVLVILLVLFVIVFFARIFTSLSVPSKAGKKTVKRVEISNLTPYEATIFWQTDSRETGWVTYGESANNFSKVAIDERDIAAKKGSFVNHYVILRNLAQTKRYFFKLIVSNQLIGNPDGSAFSFATPQNLQTVQSQNPAYGKVLKSNTLPLENASVILTFNDAYPLVALTKSSGEWLIPLNTVFLKDTLQTKNISSAEKIKIEIMSEDNQASTIYTNLGKVSPLPDTTIIGKNYDFTNQNNVLSAQSSNGEIKQKIDIIYPTEGSIIPGRIPLIKGIVLPNSEVIVTVNSTKTYSSKVTSDATGIWSYSLPEALELGEHTITINTKDINGNQVAIVRKFVIAANEGNEAKVLAASTEATLTPTAIPTLLPTYGPTSTSSATVSTTTKPPVSGGSSFIPAAIGAALIIVGAGFILAF